MGKFALSLLLSLLSESADADRYLESWSNNYSTLIFYGKLPEDSKKLPSDQVINPAFALALAAAGVEQDYQPNDSGSSAAISPLNLAGHEAAGEDVDTLEDPDDADAEEQDADDSQCYAHWFGLWFQ